MLTFSYDLDGACGASYLCLVSCPGTKPDNQLLELRFRVHTEEKMDEAPEENWGPLYWVCFPSTLGLVLGWAHTSVSILHKQFQTECLMQPMSEGIVDSELSSKASLKHSTKVQICTFSGYLYGYLKMLCPSLLPTYFILRRHSAQMLTLSMVLNISK